jgi:hypothetical protein
LHSKSSRFRVVCTLLPIFCAPGAAWGASAGALRPNVIFIIADDLGYGEPGCFGGKVCRRRTPVGRAMACGSQQLCDRAVLRRLALHPHRPLSNAIRF